MNKTYNRSKSTDGDAKANYAFVNGLELYYEIHGVGKPLVMLHGGLSTIDDSFGRILPSLAKSLKIVAVEQQAHGHTADIDRPLTYEQMAEDTVALLHQLKIERTDFLGYSDGGAIALRIGMKYPNLVRKIIVIGTGYSNEGLAPGLSEAFKNMKPEDAPKELRDLYDKVAPDPNNWPTLVSKVKELGQEFKGWRAEDIRSIKAPTMVMIGDADIIRPEHAVEMSRLLPHSHLAIMPMTDHYPGMLQRHPNCLISLIMNFLNAPMPEVE